MKPTEGTPSPADFPVGSPESRAAARLLAESDGPLERALVIDADGNPRWDTAVTYSGSLVIIHSELTEEEWLEDAAYLGARREGDSEELKRERVVLSWALQELFRENDDIWQKGFAALLTEYRERVPGAVAKTRIPKGRTREDVKARFRADAEKAQDLRERQSASR